MKIEAEITIKARKYDGLDSAIRAGGYDEVNSLFSILASKDSKKKLSISLFQPEGEIVLLGAARHVYRQEIESERRCLKLEPPTLEDALLIGEQFPKLHSGLSGRGIVFFTGVDCTISWSGYSFYPVIEVEDGSRRLTLKQLNDPHDGYRYVWAYRKTY